MFLQENEDLDKDIHRLLSLLSPWSFEPNAHLVLEYLVRRYRIHEFNVDALLRATLVAHDTKIFAKIVQLCKIVDTPWIFFIGVKESGVPIPRTEIVKRIIKTPWLLEALSDSVLSALKVAGVRKIGKDNVNVSNLTIQGVEKILSFFTAILIELAEMIPFDDGKMRSIYIFLSEGLKTHLNPSLNQAQIQLLTDWKNACCVIIAQLCRKTKFGGPLSKSLSKGLAMSLLNAKSAEMDANRQSIAFHVLVTSCILCQHNQLDVSLKYLSSLYSEEGNHSSSSPSSSSSATSWFLQSLQQMSTDYHTAAFVSSIAWCTFKALIQDKKDEEESDDSYLSSALLSQQLSRLIQHQLLATDVVKDIMQRLLSTHIQSEHWTSQDASLVDAIQRFVKSVSHWMPRIFDDAVTSSLQSCKDHAGKEKINLFLSQMFVERGNVVQFQTLTGDSLFMALNSPLKELRVQALHTYSKVSFIAEEQGSNESVGLAQAALRSVEDFDVTVVEAVFKANTIKTIVFNIAADEVFVTVKQALIHWIKYSVITTSAVGHEMLRVIVDALADQATLQRLLNSEGKLYEMLNMLVSLIFGEAFRQAQALLKSAVQLVKLISKEFSLFQNVDFSKVLSKNGALNVSVWMDATATELKKDEKSIAVVQGMFKQSPQHFADAADVVISLGVASFISKLVESLQGANLTQAQRILQSYLTPVVLRMINSLTATTEISSLHILPTLRNFFNVCGSINKVETKKDVDLMAFISSLALTQNASRVNFEVIEAILLSPNAAIVELIDVAMESMFPNAYNQLLLTLILDKNTHLSASQSAQIKTTSLQIFVMYVQSMLRKKASSDVDTHVILCSVAVLMWSCAHNHSSVRKLGVKLASVLQESFDSKQVLKWKKSSSLVQDLSLEGSALHIITKLIQDKESTIMLQSDALLHLVSEQLESNPKLKTFSETLWILVNVFGWTFDEFSKSLLCIVKHCTSLDFSWPILQHLLNALKDKAGNDTLIELILQAIEVAFTKAAVSTQEAIIKYSITILQSPNEDRIHYLKTNLLSLFAKGIIESSNNAAVHELYEVLMEQQLSRPGDVAVLDALAALNIEPSIPLELLLKEMKVVLALSEDGKDDKKSENDEDAMELDNHGFALPLQRLIALIEAAAPTIVKYKKVTDNELSSLVAALLEVLRITNLPAVKTVLSIEYYKAVVLEAAFQSLALMEKNEMLKSISGSTASVVATNKKDSKTKGKAAATSQTVSSSEKFQVYKLDRIEGDIKSIMNCLGSLRTSQVQTSAFGLLRILIRLKPSTALLTMQELGHLLSAATTAVVASREKFLSGILELLLGIMQEIPADSTDAQVSIQSIIQNLCVQLPAISLGHRSALLKSALKVLQHSHASSVAMVHVLLAHTLLAYESEQVFTQQKVESVENICFSRAAQRRAKRAMNSTGPEEFYSLSIQMFLEFDAAEQVQTLSVLLGTALDLTMLSVKDNNEVESNVINVDSTVSYMLQLLPSSKATNDMKFGYAATLALLHMEFVLEMMEHKKFHLSQAKALSRSNPINIQSHFLAIADTILRLVALTESTRKSNKITSGKDKMNLRMEDQVFSISVKSLMDIMTSWSLDALHCLQKLLDGPSFVSIVQELLNHELLSIRQKAVLVLKDRLQLMLQDKVSNNNEVTLYFDLSARMRSMISKFFQQHVQNDKNISEEISSARSSQSALVQSAIMCLDVLMQYLGKVATWKDELLAILAEFLEYVPVMYKSCSVESKLAVHAKPLELKKLLGSVLLACSTICKVLGAVTLPFFGVSLYSHCFNTSKLIFFPFFNRNLWNT